VVYDNQTCLRLQTDKKFPIISNQKEVIAINADTSVEVWLGPTVPKEYEANWVQTVSGMEWNVLHASIGLNKSGSTRPGCTVTLKW
jgi:hypothetical protein